MRVRGRAYDCMSERASECVRGRASERVTERVSVRARGGGSLVGGVGESAMFFKERVFFCLQS